MTRPAATTVSDTMMAALAEMHVEGALIRYQGGFWARPGAPRDHNGLPQPNWGTSTINAVVKRGAAAFTKHREGRSGAFPIRVEPVEEPKR